MSTDDVVEFTRETRLQWPVVVTMLGGFGWLTVQLGDIRDRITRLEVGQTHYTAESKTTSSELRGLRVRVEALERHPALTAPR